MIDKSKYLSAKEVSRKLKISVMTLGNWYAWYNNPEYPKPAEMPSLPPYFRVDNKGTRAWNIADFKELEKFKKWIPRGRGGVMAAQSSKSWGRRAIKKFSA